LSMLTFNDEVVLFGVESDFTPDVVDTIGRLGAKIFSSVLLEPSLWDLDGLSPIAECDILSDHLRKGFFVTRNNPGLRRANTLKAESIGFSSLVTIIDPTAVVSSTARIGNGVYVNAGAVIGGQVLVGNSVFINRLAGVGHHSILEDFVSIGPGASLASKVRIGRGSMVGAGACISPSVTIGSNSVIAAGAAVHKDVPSNTVVIGNPCRIAKTGIVGHGGFGV
jgi:sugar O-acyltransferase (sialic acid O-acetyltransferase NeuD family)